MLLAFVVAWSGLAAVALSCFMVIPVDIPVHAALFLIGAVVAALGITLFSAAVLDDLPPWIYGPSRK